MDVRFGATFALFIRHLACPSSSPTLERAGSLVAVLDSLAVIESLLAYHRLHGP